MRRTSLLLLLLGCGNVSQQSSLVPTSIPRLRATAENGVAHGGVVVSVEPITSLTWRNYPEITARLSILVEDITQVGGIEGEGPPKLTLRRDDLLMLGLPAFRLRVSNTTGKTLSFANAHARLEDDRHGVNALDMTAVREEVERQLRLRKTRFKTNINPDQVSAVRAAVDDLPILKPDRVIPPETEWRGYVSFHFESEQPVTHLVMQLDGVTLDGEALPAFRFPFVVERRHAARACKDGSVATPLGVCPGDEDEITPAADGPCIQATRMINNSKRKQWWVGGEPIANSDLHSTLMSQPESRQAIRRGLIYRGLGYALIFGGLGVAAMSAVGFSQAFGAKYGPSGIAFLSLSLVGGIFTWRGNRRSDDAVRAYNEQADAGGKCGVVY